MNRSSSSDRPPQIPKACPVRRANALHCSNAGHVAQIALARPTRRARESARSASGPKNGESPIPSHATGGQHRPAPPRPAGRPTPPAPVAAPNGSSGLRTGRRARFLAGLTAVAATVTARPRAWSSPITRLAPFALMSNGPDAKRPTSVRQHSAGPFLGRSPWFVPGRGYRGFIGPNPTARVDDGVSHEITPGQRSFPDPSPTEDLQLCSSPIWSCQHTAARFTCPLRRSHSLVPCPIRTGANCSATVAATAHSAAGSC